MTVLSLMPSARPCYGLTTLEALWLLYKRDLKEYSLELNESQAVRTTTLESYIETKKVGHVNLLKVDVEGHELRVLEGAGRYLSPC